jgi:hypothetical protein
MSNSANFVLRGIAIFFVCALFTAADHPSNPYGTIVDRNVFGLKPVPPPPPAEPEEPAPQRITLTGITTILGDKRVLLKTERTQTADGLQKPQQFYILTIGQREGSIEVVDIDEKTGNVTLNNSGIMMTLNIDRDGPKLSGNHTIFPGALPPPPPSFLIGTAPLPARFHLPGRRLAHFTAGLEIYFWPASRRDSLCNGVDLTG